MKYRLKFESFLDDIEYHRPSLKGKIKGLTEQQILDLESEFGHPFPLVYRSFLTVFGDRKNTEISSFFDKMCFAPEIYTVISELIEDAEEEGVDARFADDFLCIDIGYDTWHSFVHCNGEEDPIVYSYFYGDSCVTPNSFDNNIGIFVEQPITLSAFLYGRLTRYINALAQRGK